MSELRQQAMILAVDDTPENLDVVKGLLVPEYQVRVAPNGQIGLKIARAQRPDLILLDIMMPEIDGYEVCRQLKADPDTADIPVIFLTAKGETEDQAAGFELGAADYILKPINPTLLRARVKTHIALKSSLDQLKRTGEELAKAKAKMEDELNVGQRIQLSMLPTVAPRLDDFNVFATMRAARQVGGDLYDYFFIDPKRYCVCVADVSDKGVPASLFMAVTKTLIRASTSDDHSTASIVTRINNELARDNDASMFVTIFLAIYDIHSGCLTYTNAGHNPPFIKRADGAIESVNDLHGPVAGAVEELAYKESQLQLRAGDTLLLYTDGVSEAMNSDDELFGEQRISSLLQRADVGDAESLCSELLAEVDSFAGDAEQSDDITLLALVVDKDAQVSQTEVFEIELVNQFSEIDRLNDAFNEYADRVEIDMATQLKINMVFDELINNIISYGFNDQREHKIMVRADRGTDELIIQIEDGGIPFNPFLRETPDVGASLEERDIGGLGIHLVKEVMDSVSYQRNHHLNRVMLVKNL